MKRLIGVVFALCASVGTALAQRSDDEDPEHYLPTNQTAETLTSLPYTAYSHIYRRRLPFGTEALPLSIGGLTTLDALRGTTAWSEIYAFRGVREGDRQASWNTPFLRGRESLGLVTSGSPLAVEYRWNPSPAQGGFRVNSEYVSTRSPWKYALQARYNGARDRFFNGAFFDGGSASATLGYDLTARQRVTATLAASRSSEGQRGITTHEVYDLVASSGRNPYSYNPLAGDQQGRVRNACVRENSVATASLGYALRGEAWEVTCALGAATDSYSVSGLERFDAAAPGADYYAALPSYFSGAAAEELRTEWRQNPAAGDLDWERLYRINYADPAAAHYLLASRTQDRRAVRGAVHTHWKPTPRWQVTLDGESDFQQIESYKTVADLLGASAWDDIDTYLVDDAYYGDYTRNNVRGATQQVHRGDRFGYDYRLFAHDYRVRAAALWRAGNTVVSGYVGYRNRTLQREGRFEKELFAGTGESFGRSLRQSYSGWECGAEISYVPAVTTSLYLRGWSAPRVTSGYDAFEDIYYRNAPSVGSHIGSQIGVSGGATWSNRSLVMTAEIRYAESENPTTVVRRYDEISRLFCNYTVSQVRLREAALNVSLETALTEQLTLAAHLELGAARYADDARYRQNVQKDGALLCEGERLHLKGLRWENDPDLRGAFALRWSPRYDLWMNATAAYVGKRAAQMDWIRRSDAFLRMTQSPAVRDVLVEQQFLASAATLDVSVGKTFEINQFARITLVMRCDNLTNTHVQRYGREQQRLRSVTRSHSTDYSPLGARFSYDYPRTFGISVRVILDPARSLR